MGAGETHELTLEPQDWISTQMYQTVSRWGLAIETHHPTEVAAWRDPNTHIRALRERWNSFDAASSFDWSTVLDGSDLKVLDFGCGTGWLSAILSKYDAVGSIDALDSDFGNLREMLPAIIHRLEGNPAKIRPIRGLFCPLLVPDRHYDLIVASSAIHHAPDLDLVLSELHRVLKPTGHLVLLNETPLTRLQYFWLFSKKIARFALAVVRPQSLPQQSLISHRGLLVDPQLGDWTYPLGQWRSAFEHAGFHHRTLRSGLPSYKDKPGSAELIHFVLRPRS